MSDDYIECLKCGKMYYKHSTCLCELEAPTEQINVDSEFPHVDTRKY